MEEKIPEEQKKEIEAAASDKLIKEATHDATQHNVKVDSLSLIHI